jgi:hypothetical protein
MGKKQERFPDNERMGNTNREVSNIPVKGWVRGFLGRTGSRMKGSLKKLLRYKLFL